MENLDFRSVRYKKEEIYVKDDGAHQVLIDESKDNINELAEEKGSKSSKIVCQEAQ